MSAHYQPATESGLQPAHTDEIERRYGRFGERERRDLRINIDDVADSGAGQDKFTVRGHAAVFDTWSLDLGGFKEKIAASAFDNVLSRNPDIWLLWDHDTRYVLARTLNKTLELRIDPRGMHYWARVAPTGYAEDLRVLMERGDIDQASFAFTVKRDEWKITGEGDDEKVERTILEVGDLYDVTITAMGAYPQTDSQVARTRAVDYATRTGRLERGATVIEPPAGDSSATEPPHQGDPAEHRVAPDEPVGEETRAPSVADLKAMSQRARTEMTERHLQAMKELFK